MWRFSYDRASIQRAFDHDLPAIRALYADLGFDLNHSKLLGLIQHWRCATLGAAGARILAH